jgi:hypothetical protein
LTSGRGLVWIPKKSNKWWEVTILPTACGTHVIYKSKFNFRGCWTKVL